MEILLNSLFGCVGVGVAVFRTRRQIPTGWRKLLVLGRAKSRAASEWHWAGRCREQHQIPPNQHCSNQPPVNLSVISHLMQSDLDAEKRSIRDRTHRASAKTTVGCLRVGGSHFISLKYVTKCFNNNNFVAKMWPESPAMKTAVSCKKK